MLKIKDNKLETCELLYIHSTQSTIEVVGDFPITSKVKCYIEGPFQTYYFPLVYKETIDEGNVFSSVFIIDDNSLTIQKLNNNTQCSFYIQIDNTVIEGKQLIELNPKIISNIDSQVSTLIKEVNDLKQLVKGRLNELTICNSDIKKGMVPVATGVGDTYTWDYMFDNITKNLTELSSIMTNVSSAIDVLTKRINDIEVKLHDHIYESYYI